MRMSSICLENPSHQARFLDKAAIWLKITDINTRKNIIFVVEIIGKILPSKNDIGKVLPTET